MRRKIGPLLGGLLLALSLGAPAGATQSFAELTPASNPFRPLSTEMVNESTNQWLITLSGKAVIDGGSATKLKEERAAFKRAAAAAGLQLKVTREFDGLINGLAVTASPALARQYGRISGVESVVPNLQFTIPDAQPVITPEMFTALSQTGADVAQSELGLSGRGIKVAVMDTGIDYHHPDLGGGFGPGYRVAYGYDFVGNAFNADPTSPSYNPVPTPDPDPDDCQGHGTHVAGIVGANGTVKGVAPGVTFGAYRVFGCTGSTTADIMIAAMEMAWRDGMDVLNMSIGSAFTWPQYPTAVAASKLVKKGMVVVASIGNSGADGLYSAGAPGLGEDVIGVAAFENTHNFFTTFTVAPDGLPVGYQGATAAPPAPLSGTHTVVVVAPGSASAGCSASGGVPASVAGKIALIQRGTCPFAEKAVNAQAAGAVGVVIYNNAAGRINATVEGATPITIPVVTITTADGLAMRSRMIGGQGQMTWTAEQRSFESPLANTISSFSSYGLSPDLTLKPDIGAPGGNIYSTYPLEKGGYATLGGTSMSSPHVAGAVALLLQAKPGLKATEVRSILQNTAEPQLWWGNPALGFLDNVVRQGAGMLQIDKAVLNSVTVTPGKLSLGESEGGPKTFHLQLKNDSNKPVTYTLGAEAGIAVGGNTYAPSFYGPGTDVSFSSPTVTVNGKATANVKVTIGDPGYAQGTQFGGWITLTPSNNGQVLRVPYAGFAGDYQAVQVLTPTPYGFPWLAVQIEENLYGTPDGWSFSMEGEDIAHLLLHLNHPSELLRAEVVDAVTGKSLGLAFPEESYLPRNPTATGFFDLPWDGYLYNPGGKAKLAPEGSYRVVLRFLKANGAKNNPAHWESWTSPPITIDRP